MKIWKPIIGLALVLFIASCASIGPKERWAQGCDAWGSALWALTVARDAGKLNDGERMAISIMVPQAQAVCSSPTPTAEDADTIDQLVGVLRDVQNNLKQRSIAQ